MSNIEINFRIVGEGWANLEFGIADRFFVAESISRTTDVLGDLLRAALMVATGAPRASISFDREPAEWRLNLMSLFDSSAGRGPVQIQVLEFADIHEAKPDNEGVEVFKADCPAVEFSRAILAMVDGVKDSLGLFVSLYPFPSAAYCSLKTALDTYDGSGKTSSKPEMH